MTDHETLRFVDWHHYDIATDRQVVRLLGITGKGTYTAEFGIEGPRHLRERTQVFKDYVLECMANNIDPHEVDMECHETQ